MLNTHNGWEALQASLQGKVCLSHVECSMLAVVLQAVTVKEGRCIVQAHAGVSTTAWWA